jgi:hypothetical protein
MDFTFVVLLLFNVVSLSCIVVLQRTKGWLDTLPSLSWFVLMVLPFTVQWFTISSAYRHTQALGIFIISVALFIGDYYPCSRINTGNDKTQLNNQFISNYKLYILVFITITISHLLSMREIPLLEMIAGTDKLQIAVLRENSSKLLAVPTIFKYFFTWTTTVIAPIAFSLMYYREYYMRAYIFASCALVYAALTTALFPSLMLISTMLIIVLSNKSRTHIKRPVKLLLVVLFIVIVTRAIAFFITNPLSGFTYEPRDVPHTHIAASHFDPRDELTLADRFRRVPPILLTEQKIYNYVVYRALLTPSDVSSRWYQYYPDVNGGFAGIRDYLPGGRDEGYVHPSRLVGKWAYWERMPNKYLPTINAYASIDADSYARLGMPGIIVSGIILLGLRLLMKCLKREDPLNNACYIIGTVQLSLLPVQASVMAIMVAQGLLLVIVLMCLSHTYIPRFSRTF